ncbi:oxidoreductase [Leptolyngbya sp. Heron Island J]|uniref:NAD(P)-binding domain-containing protein n=1 Tax=Leptolyngbya sp. Heron Island J TaxID=1385935 RepID=UPI0003B94247|nr:NAD(P)/FAD-dependent oxidoreductase [Leptolyngbya sp. Heron Island J]ESA33782.1 oxidoreductase [Leptolyngbya sp. Heron Island J]
MTSVHCPPSLPKDFDPQAFWTLPPLLADADQRLQRLATDIATDLELLSYPSRTWDYSRHTDSLEVAIIGAGYVGKSAAFGLRRYGLSQVRIFDRCSPGQEGPWRTYARNATLRTPKDVTGGLDWGMPNLNFRRWCAACYGDEYWQQIRYIPRLLWADYLDWYGNILKLPIQYHTDIVDIHWQADEQCFWLQTMHKGMGEIQKARFIIFATGMDCAGGQYVPAIVQTSLPADCYHHTMDTIDFVAMAGQRVGIIGGGASAFDNGIMALQAGAESVDIMIRRPQLPNLNRIRWSEWNGYHRHFIDLPDGMKWAYSLAELRVGQLPPPHTYYQAITHPRLTLYTNAPVNQLNYQKGEVVGQYGELTLRHDVLICGTGFVTDLDAQPELKTLAPYIARWEDRYTPPPGDEHLAMARYPYLGKSLQFTPVSSDYAYLNRCYYLSSGAALLSGYRANLSGLQFALPRVTYDIGRQLFLDHQDEIWAAYNAYDIKEY